MMKIFEELQLLMRYAVPDVEVAEAKAFADRYQDDPVILRLLREYYSTLPESREEAVRRITKLTSRQGVFLFVVSTTKHEYLYVVSAETVVWLAEYGEEVSTEVLSFFEYESQSDFLKQCIATPELEEYKAQEVRDDACPACGVLEGEEHLLGCIVEICPWCEGQLNSCNCRFEQLEVEELLDEEQLERFEDLLTAKGRVPFRKDDKPAYPGTSEGLDSDNN